MDWFEEQVGEFDSDYLVIDCPGDSLYFQFTPVRCRILLMRNWNSFFIGQIELYTHHPFFPSLVANLNRLGVRTCAVYLIESQFMEDKYKFFRSAVITYCIARMSALNTDWYPSVLIVNISGVMSAMSSMVNLELPWINIMTKMDLVSSKADDPAAGRNGIRKRRNIARWVRVQCEESSFDHRF